MLVKEVITILLISGTLGIEQFQDDTQEISEKDFRIKQNKKHLEKSGHWLEEKDGDAAQQFEKDYHRWSEDQYMKHASDKHKANPNYMKINEIDDFEYVDKYNKYGKTFNPDFVDAKKKKVSYHDKETFENEQHEKGNDEPKHLLDDTNVNYVDNNRKISGDSELINENENEKGNDKSKSLVHDTNVNHMYTNKKISGDNELINENAVKSLKSKEDYQDNYQNSDDTDLKRYKKSHKHLKKINLSVFPSNDTVMMARYIVHAVDWAAVGTLSGRGLTKGSPFVCVKATSDGVKDGSTGVPYFYMSPLDLCTQDLQKDNRVSVLVTLSETEYCKNKNLDPQDPRCAKLTLTGKIKKVKAGTKEEKFVRKALLSKHPAMTTWPSDHYWYFTKLKIEQIILINKFGGATYIKVKDYLDA